MTLAIAASCALSVAAIAAPPVGHGVNSSEKTIQKSDANGSSKSESKVLSTMESPVRFLGRAGHSIWRTPEIVSETFKGQRTVISKNGLFTRKDMNQPGQGMASRSSESASNRRG